MRMFSTACNSASITSVVFVKMASFQFYLQLGKWRKVGWVGNDTHVFLFVKIPGWKRKCEMVRCHDATASSFVEKVWGEVFTHFHLIVVKHHSSMRSSLLGLPKQSPWCQRKWWACSWLCSLPDSPFLVSVSLGFPYMVNAFFPKRLSNDFQCLSHFFWDVHKTWCCSYVGSIAKSHQAK
jgi:hypothetical protein